MDISLDSISLANTMAAETAANADRLKSTINNTSSSSSDDELMDVCKQFEAYFVEQVFKSMQATVPDYSGSTDSAMSTLKDYYKGELTQQYAKQATEQGEGLGLAKILYDQMKRNYNV